VPSLKVFFANEDVTHEVSSLFIICSQRRDRWQRNGHQNVEVLGSDLHSVILKASIQMCDHFEWTRNLSLCISANYIHGNRRVLSSFRRIVWKGLYASQRKKLLEFYGLEILVGDQVLTVLFIKKSA
jgi:hypothetical protein